MINKTNNIFDQLRYIDEDDIYISNLNKNNDNEHNNNKPYSSDLQEDVNFEITENLENYQNNFNDLENINKDFTEISIKKNIKINHYNNDELNLSPENSLYFNHNKYDLDDNSYNNLILKKPFSIYNKKMFDIKRELFDNNYIQKIYNDNVIFNSENRLIINTPFNPKNIISYGLIVFCLSTQKWLIVQRKHSVEFILYMKGNYKISHLPILFSKITKNEIDIILKCIYYDKNYFFLIYINELNFDYKELEYAFARFLQTSNIILKIIKNNYHKFSKNILSWNWPKGRLNFSGFKENSFQCACREFFEEVEIELPKPIYLSNNFISNTTKTLNNLSIESRYWIYIIDEEINIPPVKYHLEISNRKWVSKTECEKLIFDKFFFNNIFSSVQNIISKL